MRKMVEKLDEEESLMRFRGMGWLRTGVGGQALLLGREA
jgi:hypothetical protein